MVELSDYAKNLKGEERARYMAKIADLGEVPYLRIIPKKVKCWFCHHETSVVYESSNNWICESCEQYNGFDKDGGYNMVIPNQHESKMNSSCYTYPTPGTEVYPRNKLCDKCNLKQQLKVQQLASFVPINEKNYDEEVEHFQKQIEKAFGLCQDCDALVSKVLYSIREKFSLPKKLSAAISKVNIRGEKAMYINILLSLLIAFSSINFKIELSLPSKFKEDLNQTFYSNEVLGELLSNLSTIYYHSLTSTVLSNSVLILIGTGIFTNSIGFYQTNAPTIFLIILSWILMFFLKLYPSGFDDVIDVLKVISSLVSMAFSVLILLENNYKKTKKKPSLLAKKNTQNSPALQHLSRSHSPANLSPPSSVFNGKLSPSQREDSPPYGLRSGMNSLSLEVRPRREIPRPASRLINPAKFNPFTRVSPPEKTNLNHSQSSRAPSERYYQGYNKSGGCSTYDSLVHPPKLSSDKNVSSFAKSERSYQVLGKGGGFYEPSLTPPSVFEGYDQPDPVATIPPYSFPQTCYPCSPTLAYYFTQQLPKVLPTNSFPVSSTPNTSIQEINQKSSLWSFLYIVPFTFLVVCNLVLICTVYIRGV